MFARTVFVALWFTVVQTQTVGAIDVVFSANPATVGDAVKITCTKDSTLVDSVSWLNQRHKPITLSLCLHTDNVCIPSISNIDDRYSFNSHIAKRKFTMTITNVKQADAGVYTCKDSSPDVGQATLQVQTGKTEDGRLTDGEIGGIAAVVLILGVSIGFLCYTGYFPGRWSDTVLIQQKNHPNIKFEEVLSFAILKEIMQETGTSINLRGKGSVMYRMPGQDDSLTNMPVEDQPLQDEVFIMPVTDQPLEIYVTAVFKIRVQRAVEKILIKMQEGTIKQLEAIYKHTTVIIPQQFYQDTKFEQVLNEEVLKEVETQTVTKIRIYGEGSDKYGERGKYYLPGPYQVKPLQIFIISNNPNDVKKAYDKIKAIIQEAINNKQSRRSSRRHLANSRRHLNEISDMLIMERRRSGRRGTF